MLFNHLSSYDDVVSQETVGSVVRLLSADLRPWGLTAVTLTNPPQNLGRSLLELDGAGQEIWAEIDARQYVDELRDEWESS